MQCYDKNNIQRRRHTKTSIRRALISLRGGGMKQCKLLQSSAFHCPIFWRCFLLFWKLWHLMWQQQQQRLWRMSTMAMLWITLRSIASVHPNESPKHWFASRIVTPFGHYIFMHHQGYWKCPLVLSLSKSGQTLGAKMDFLTFFLVFLLRFWHWQPGVSTDISCFKVDLSIMLWIVNGYFQPDGVKLSTKSWLRTHWLWMSTNVKETVVSPLFPDLCVLNHIGACHIT